MIPGMRAAALLCLAAGLSFAGTWSGALVDFNCYLYREWNVNPHDTLTNVDRDKNLDVDYCSPNAKTKSFTVVERNGLSFRLDSRGNAQAAELVRKAGNKPLYVVSVTGQMRKNTVQVNSISLAR